MFLTLDKAAKVLQMNPESLRRKVKCGEVPGAKVGRAWLFYEPDLVAHLRSLYCSPRALQGKEDIPCSAKLTAVQTGSSNSRLPTGREYAELLGLPTKS